MEEYLDLIKYRDAGMNSYTYFWKNYFGKIVSPYFDSHVEAIEWANVQKYELLNLSVLDNV